MQGPPPEGSDRLREDVSARRRVVLSDPRRPEALALFRQLYGIPDTSVMDQLAVHGCFLLRADAAAFAMRDDSGVHWHGSVHAQVPTAPLRPERTLADWAVVAGTPLLFDDTTGFPEEFADVEALQWRAAAALPLLIKGVAVGALLIGRTTSVPWGQRERDSLRHWMSMHAILNERRALVAGAEGSAHERLGAVFEKVSVAMAIIDAEGRFEHVNFAFAALAGRGADTMPGLHVRDLVRPIPGDPTGHYLEELLDGRRLGYTVERVLVRPDGRERRVRVTVAALRYEKGGRHSHLSILEDVTDLPDVERVLREREEALRQAQRRDGLSQIAGGLAHDFSNTLAAISGFASLLRDDLDPDDPRREDAIDILRVTERASDVVERLLTMSTQVVAQHATFDLCEVLRSFSSVARRVLPTSIEWRLDLPTEAVHATVDRTRFEQALLALVVNARDVMPSGGALRVVLSTVTHEDPGAPPQQLARIAVTDTGPGIPADVAPRLWDPFFTTKAGGAGLGLPVALAIAREHDGDIRLESPPDRGATFAVYLPLGVRAPTAVRRAGAAVETTTGAGTSTYTILLVEDEATVRVTSARLLERAGFRILLAEDGEMAWERFLAHTDAIDAVVTDLQMPRLGGHELIRRMRQRRPDLPVVVTSAHAAPDLDDRVKRELVSASLRKPFAAATLVQTLRAVLTGTTPRRP